jgi:hypothetical protein
MVACEISARVTARLRSHDDPMLQRPRFESYRIHASAAKWDRHMSSTRGGLTVTVTGDGSRYADLQAFAPCANWQDRLSQLGYVQRRGRVT